MRTRLGSMSPAGAAAIPPTVEFPSQRRERVDWHKLASVDMHDLASGCSIEFLQENLSHVTFCDAEAEFDLNTPSGQRSLLKMYRLAQLIIQYLFLWRKHPNQAGSIVLPQANVGTSSGVPVPSGDYRHQEAATSVLE